MKMINKIITFIFLLIVFLPFVLSDNITINNIGETGFEQISNEFTSRRLVILIVNYSQNTEYCRYINFDDPSTLPLNDNANWSNWQACINEKFWEITKNDGNKTVYAQINYSSGSSYTVNDSIFYNSTGAGLDVTNPSAPIIASDYYINNLESVEITWQPANDFESVNLLKIPIKYRLDLFNESLINIVNVTTLDDSYLFTNLDLSDNETLTLNLSAINSAGLENTTKSTIKTDLENPEQPTILAVEFQNRTTSLWQTLDENNWVDAIKINLSWQGQDNLSYVDAFSYIIENSKIGEPDDVPEGPTGNYDAHNETILSSIGSDEFYFKIKSRDAAGNWGNFTARGLRVDITPPTKPEIISSVLDADNRSINFTWYDSTDEESGIFQYMINVTNNVTGYNQSFTTNETSYKYFVFSGEDKEKYYAKIGAQNNAGIWKWSDEKDTISDTQPPQFLHKKPSGNIATNYPIFSIWTDETAECTYEIGSINPVSFKYTNTTYHETRLFLADNSYVYTINCTDPFGNSATSSLSFTTTSLSPDDIGISIESTVYEGEFVEALLSINNTDAGLGNILKEDISLAIDNEEKDFSLTDIGDGLYNLSFIAPDDPGIYNLVVSSRSQTDSIILTVNDLEFTFLFDSENGITAFSDENLQYNSSSTGVFGAASDGEKSNIGGGNYLFNVTTSINENIYIFNTRSDRFLLKRNELLKNMNFIDSSNPSFGYRIEPTFYSINILDYDDIDISTDIINELLPGQYVFILENIRDDEGDREIFISTDIEENEKKVYQYK